MAESAPRSSAASSFIAAFDEAIGKHERLDPVEPRSGGPAGNGVLTAYLGAALFVLFIIEVVTLLDVHGLISWHIVVGTLLVPFALMKTASTGWRILRYYTHFGSYQQVEPPPMPLRVLGPLVVVSTLAMLGTGLALIAMGPQAGRQPTLWFGLDMLTLHQASFIAAGVIVSLHVLARVVPAWRRFTKPTEKVPGQPARWGVLVLTVAVAVVTSVLVLGASNSWRNDTFHGDFHHGFPAGASLNR